MFLFALDLFLNLSEHFSVLFGGLLVESRAFVAGGSVLLALIFFELFEVAPYLLYLSSES